MSANDSKEASPWSAITIIAVLAVGIGLYRIAINSGKPTPEYVEELLRQAQGPTDKPRQPPVNGRLEEGRAALQKDDPETAITVLTALLDQEPGNAEAYYLRSIAYQKKGDRVLALTDYLEAIRLNPAIANRPTP